MSFDFRDELDLLLRLLAGTAAGIVVGWERTSKQRAAGIRTFGLVGLGTAAAATIFSEPHQADAASRVIQGLVTGIGFLGAGVIVLRKGETTPQGLTTAAAIWVTAALGCAAGLGHHAIVLSATILAVGLLAVDHSIERWAGRPGQSRSGAPPDGTD
ncbi:MgtC/SapB family protein [Bosea sp. CS1GBMeth4]|uniref:MgtC/SapB family protein n=1 Tax=Bosea sp. CS1GBMeth4 TaxID=1892849 RepID=UPI001644B965|nr:MgtC/SapB family protein [Bosea sp. CS1GBMeth4]